MRDCDAANLRTQPQAIGGEASKMAIGGCAEVRRLGRLPAAFEFEGLFALSAVEWLLFPLDVRCKRLSPSAGSPVFVCAHL